jgi:short-subunit dehydrogenase
MKQKAVVTGASKGIGKAIAEILITSGYEVVGTSRNPKAMNKEDVVEGVKYLPLDLSDEKSVEAFIKAAGEADILINNAGQSQSGAVEDVPIDRVRYLFDINVINQVRIIQGFLPGMRKKGSGTIINVTSMAAKTPMPFSTFYGSTKAAMETFTRGPPQRSEGIRNQGRGRVAFQYQDGYSPGTMRGEKIALFRSRQMRQGSSG